MEDSGEAAVEDVGLEGDSEFGVWEYCGWSRDVRVRLDNGVEDLRNDGAIDDIVVWDLIEFFTWLERVEIRGSVCENFRDTMIGEDVCMWETSKYFSKKRKTSSTSLTW